MSHSPTTPGPFALRASLHETIWGGQRLREIAGKPLPTGKRIGESWETALDSVVETEPHAGMTLEAMVARYGAALLGARSVAVYGLRFPLLAKFIDAHDWLSVQAHPDDAYAAENEGGKLGKTEAWYILGAEPGAQIVYGLARETSRAEAREAIVNAALEPLLNTIEACAGDVIFVPAGTVHAIGAGVTLYELQEYSDVTYRLYDYGRLQPDGQPRELHVERALDVIRYARSPLERFTAVESPSANGASRCATLVACRYFIEQEVTLDGAMREAPLPTSCRILTVLRGEAEIVAEGYASVQLGLGATAVLPASLGEVSVRGAGTLVRSYVPEPDDAALALWRQAHASMFSTE